MYFADIKERNLLYVVEVETFVTRAIRPFSTDTFEAVHSSSPTLAPTHFFGEVVKTPEGCQLLRDRNIVAEFADTIRIHGMEDKDEAILTNVKSVLWALVSLLLCLIMSLVKLI
jgi:rapamycin-insensitive companion of mTOR